MLLLIWLLAACGGLGPTPAALSVQNSEPLRLSGRADRAQAVALGGAAVSGDVYIFAVPPKAVREVRFYLGGKPVQRARAAPHDLMGGTRRQANALDTRTLADGPHTLRAVLEYKNGRRSGVRSTFTVNNAPPAPDNPADGTRWQPTPGTSWQWQLQGPLDLSLEVGVYDLDLFDAPASTIRALQARGVWVICYFSAGSFEPWRDDAGAFPGAVKGKKMDDWDELWLDIRNLEQLAPVMKARLDLAAAKGCNAVEPDNVDAYANDSGFPLTGADQLAYNRFLAASARPRAHRRPQERLGASQGARAPLRFRGQ